MSSAYFRFPQNGICCPCEPEPPTTIECFDCPNQEAAGSWLATLTITGGGTCSQAQCESWSGQYVLDFVGSSFDCRWEFVRAAGPCELGAVRMSLIDNFPLAALASVEIDGNAFAFTFNNNPADCVSEINFGAQTNSDGTCGTATLVVEPI